MQVKSIDQLTSTVHRARFEALQLQYTGTVNSQLFYASAYILPCGFMKFEALIDQHKVSRLVAPPPTTGTTPQPMKSLLALIRLFKD